MITKILHINVADQPSPEGIRWACVVTDESGSILHKAVETIRVRCVRGAGVYGAIGDGLAWAAIPARDAPVEAIVWLADRYVFDQLTDRRRLGGPVVVEMVRRIFEVGLPVEWSVRLANATNNPAAELLRSAGEAAFGAAS